jgi:plastocyanin
MTKPALIALVLWFVTVTGATGQSVLERSPSIHGVWGLTSGNMAFVFSHRFEVLSGGDELFSVPMFTLAAGLPAGLTLGVDFTTFSEAIPEELTGNEAQYWLKRPFVFNDMLQAAPLVAFNSAAGSFDGALYVRVALGRIDLFAEGRGHSDLFGSGEAGASATVGGALNVNRYLAFTGDYGRVLTEDDVPGTWSAAIALAIPASPHTLSLQVTNGGAPTLQGAAREKSTGPQDIRYGFSFTIPLGNGSRWMRLIRPEEEPATAAVAPIPATARVALNGEHQELQIRAGEAVQWINAGAVAASIEAADGSWSSGLIERGEAYRRVFPSAGRYEYVSGADPRMSGAVVVAP